MKTVFARICAAFVSLAVLAPLAVPDAQAQRRAASDAVRMQMLDGRVMSLKEIEARVLPRMQNSTYLGPEYDPQTQIYRLKFIRDNHVIFVDVDGRTGRIIRQRG